MRTPGTRRQSTAHDARDYASRCCPEAPFALIERSLRSLPGRADSLVLVNEHGAPVAWAGPTARLPVHLRPLGERTVVAEPGVGSTWLWWRESVFESGRQMGAVLAGVELPEAGSRSALGVWAGRAGAAAAPPRARAQKPPP